MTQDELTQSVPGADKLIAWFGQWPSFHDAEVIQITLVRKGLSALSLHTWLMTDAVDDEGFYVTEKHVLVRFLIEDVYAAELGGFNHQNVLFGLTLQKAESAFFVSLDGTFGVTGSLSGRCVSIEFQPGKPSLAAASTHGLGEDHA